MITIPGDLWSQTPLGQLGDGERSEFYDDLVEDESEGDYLLGNRSHLFESQAFRVAVLRDGRRFVAADACHDLEPLRDCDIDLSLDRFYVGAMPGRRFQLQLEIGAEHIFKTNRARARVGHSLAVDGIIGDYVGLMNEPVFHRLHIADLLSLSVVINFVADKDTEQILAWLKNDAVKKGITLTSVFNPVFASALSYINGLTQAILSKKKNKTVINCKMGFAAQPGPLGFPLAEATYLFAQLPTAEISTFSWEGVTWDSEKGRVVRGDLNFDFNHLILRLSPSRTMDSRDEKSIT